MTAALKATLIFFSITATAWAAVAGLTGMRPDFTVATLIAICCLLATCALDLAHYCRRRRADQILRDAQARAHRNSGPWSAARLNTELRGGFARERNPR